MTKPRLFDYLDHIRQAANEAMEFVQGMNRHVAIIAGIVNISDGVRGTKRT